MRTKNYYSILGIDPSASRADIRNAYHSRVRVIHPDRFDPSSQKREWHQANEMLAELNEAYEVLRDTSKRLKYDAELGYRSEPSTLFDESKAQNETRDAKTQSSPKHGRSSSKQSDSRTQKASNSKSGPTHLSFTNLPSDVQKKLTQRLQGKGRHFRWPAKLPWLEFAFIAGAIFWICILFYWTKDYRWKQDDQVMFVILTMASSFGLQLRHSVYDDGLSSR
jgi:curved DNA-binding protein CbpA